MFEETQFPPIEDFYSKLDDEDVSSEDYAHAQNGLPVLIYKKRA